MTRRSPGLVLAVALVASACIGTGLAGCGGSGRSSHQPSHAASRKASQPFLGDGDFDIGDGDADNNRDTDRDAPFDYYYRGNESWNRGVFHDRDDTEKLTFGTSATAAEARAISLVVRRYYSLAAKDDGRRACAMLLPSAARIVADYRLNGLPYLRGVNTCQAALHLMFRHDHLSVPHVTSVRVDGDAALALWGSRTLPAGYITLVRHGRTWAITAPVGSTLL